MENKAKNREWVKTAAIIFLAVLLVLTFFSNTIMNRTLTEVATQEVTSGAITAKVRGTGTVSAIGNTEIKAPGTTTIASVRVKSGQDVSAGDVLFILGERSEELEAAEDELQSLQFQLLRLQNSYPSTGSGNSEIVASLKLQLDAADIEVQNAYAEWMSHTVDTQAFQEAQQALDNAKLAFTNAENELNTHRNTLQTNVDNALANYTAVAGNPESTAEQIAAAKQALDLAQAELDKSYTISDPLYLAYSNAEAAVNAAQAKYDALVESTGPYKAAYDTAVAKQQSILDQYNAALEQYYSASGSGGGNTIWVDIQETQAKIKKLEEKIAELQGGEENAVTSPIAGTVTSVEVSAGSSVAKGDILCIIEVPDMGYTVSFSVTNDQAKRLKIGDSATVSNYYWGSQITATLSSIKIDPKNPQTCKLLTFDIDGDVASGSELTIAVGQKSANYDLIVPANAVRTDSNGTFVLRITAKNSALGNRYFVQRVAVEALATDDVSTAVSGDLSYGDFVVTTSSAPIKSGEQVRMSDIND